MEDKITIDQLREDITDMQVVVNQAYRDVMNANGWFHDRAEKLEGMKRRLLELESKK